MKKSFAIILLFLVFVQCFGQSSPKQVPSEIMEAIKNDVWIPFMKAYDQLDSQKIKSIHTQDIVRVTISQNNIESGSNYLEGFGGFLDSVKNTGDHLDIAFAILTSAINSTEDVAYQTGYYRLSRYDTTDAEPQYVGYGFFNVGLRKENGTWKIWLDSDSRTDISKDEFESSKIVYELEK
ncbi:MAG: hypothetical protein RIB79_02205 [Allomuricauda sp.]|jgi:ketosteroid isomerase-like protein